MISMRTFRRLAVFTTAAIVATCPLALAQEDYQIVRDFGQLGSLGPASGLIKATDGNFYGVESEAPFYTTRLYKLTPDGEYTAIAAGLPQVGDPIQASDGDLYMNGSTVISRVSLSGTLTVLHVIRNTHLEGLLAGPLVEGDDGNFYGFTRLNGDFGLGTFYHITAAGVFTTVRSLTPAEGSSDFTKLIKGSDGYFYGNMAYGGTGQGTIIRMATDGTATTLHTFTGADGSQPFGGLTEGADGGFYGTTNAGGAYGHGTIFKLSHDGIFTVLHSFTGVVPGGDGMTRINNRLLEGSDGALYGTSERTIFRLTPDGEYRVLHSTVNGYPQYTGPTRYGTELSALVEGAHGDFYGTAAIWAPGDRGAIFRLNRQRSVCANALDLSWQDWDGGTLYLTGALKSETPALLGAWLISGHGIDALWFRLTPPVTPTFTFELALPLSSMGTVGVLTLVKTSDHHTCVDWATADTGGVGPSVEELKGQLDRSSLGPWLAQAR